ncbi:ketimine reductase mu-crystallin isoform X2 [Cimex lectularius]|uniref:Ketimine reductase mu-crystallin n=1 Tax=Cimex lectularius TaxID=79782 RepID=A0A8I6RK26_CIMLE|nr:ketimine reductase mu-crystallin isoform X2 [Cimex lectularius]
MHNSDYLQNLLEYLRVVKIMLLAMPGFSSKDNSLGCKLVTSYPNNTRLGLPSIMATILLFNADTGKPEVILESRAITEWRTAATSAAATRRLHKGDKGVLAIFGTGVQAKAHALAFQHLFNFNKVKVWGRNFEKAKQLCSQLGPKFSACQNGEDCAKDADVLVTATYADRPIVQHSWLKTGVLINAIGAGINHHSELDEKIYRNAILVVDEMEAAQKELKGLLEKSINIWGEVGAVITGQNTLPNSEITIFHSLGMAIEDVLTAQLVYKIYKQNCPNNQV